MGFLLAYVSVNDAHRAADEQDRRDAACCQGDGCLVGVGSADIRRRNRHGQRDVASRVIEDGYHITGRERRIRYGDRARRADADELTDIALDQRVGSRLVRS